jgi:hypothetical protein
MNESINKEGKGRPPTPKDKEEKGRPPVIPKPPEPKKK